MSRAVRDDPPQRKARTPIPGWLPWSCLLTMTCLSSLGLLGAGIAEQL
ncbi:hypothetical protein [Streptomyces yaizuensis]|uniref:MFS transporter n=1 Tax=Streptomyces yaizuensis TaxID=2989713 RepID=A0ABQ5P959_9ACTN|nr:hypothetical protein [Streptomyces sp. YSPA8]GLF99123.1 hypothetical protein SYYSPA8_32520 [Streptomyces sp. YSPA8]